MADLLASFWTLAGDLDVTSPAASPWPFTRRVAAAAAAGYSGFGVDARDILGPGGPARLGPMRSMLADAGLVFIEVELLTGWIGRPAAGHLRRRNALLDAAAGLGARHVKVSAGFGDSTAGTAQIIDSFAAVCADAAAAGPQVVLELLPSGPVSRLDRAVRIVTGAGAANGGLLLDAWHADRAGIAPAEIAALPAGVLRYVELCDGRRARDGGLIADTTLRRLPCGAGEFDLDGFVGAVRAAGYAGPYGVEVLSASLRGQPVELVARRTAQAAADVLAR
jgi:sugar phosphate isomerase/epimerase